VDEVSPYADKTAVPVSRSRDEIERTLKRFGATAFMYGDDGSRAVVGFVVHNRQVRVAVPIPATAQEERRRWRSLNLVIKAKLEAVESGIATVEDEFLAYTVLPDGGTAGEFMRPQLDRIYREGGGMPAMLPQLGSGS
jgi:hypothetical protein